MKRFFSLFTAVMLGGLTLTTPVAAADTPEKMTFRMDGEQHYLFESDLTEKDAILSGALYIDHYTGISELKLIMKSDAPLQIINGDFTRDPSRIEYEKDPSTGEKIPVGKPCFFKETGTSYYTQQSAISDDTNIVFWTALGLPPVTGELDMPDSSFLSFEYRVPANTKAGVYTAYVSTESRYDNIGMLEQDFFAYNQDESLTDLNFIPYQLVIEPDALRGDANCDGKVDVVDALAAMIYYADFVLAMKPLNDDAQAETFKTPYIHTAKVGADANLDGAVDVTDALMILQYYAKKLALYEPDWNHLLD